MMFIMQRFMLSSVWRALWSTLASVVSAWASTVCIVRSRVCKSAFD